MEAPAARRLLKAANAETAELAGIRILKILVMVNTRKKFGGNELALAGAVKEDLACSGSSPLNKSDRVISLSPRDGVVERAPGPGLNHQASSAKLQAPSIKLSNQPVQSPSDKHPNQSNKRQASSRKLQAP